MRHLALLSTEHRPWPIPSQPWGMAQTWSNLLFAHWQVSLADLRPLISPQLKIDTFEGDAWIGVVPFELRIRPRFLPVVPKIAAFPEINVRTYVTSGGKPGVWFFSLDATSPLAVRAARWSFGLPYFDARMTCTESDSKITFQSRRSSTEVAAEFRGSYEPTSEPFLAEPKSLESWLTERYCLYAASKTGAITCTEVHHAPWSLQEARCNIAVNTMTDPLKLVLNGQPLVSSHR